jgi:hypothetical protein
VSFDPFCAEETKVKGMKNKPFFAFIVLLFSMSGVLLAQTPSVVHCIVNAEAHRSFDGDIGWHGSLPERNGIDSWEQPDRSKPFEVTELPREPVTELSGTVLSELIFSQLDGGHPQIKTIHSNNHGYEREATLIKRTPLAIFLTWEGVPSREFYTAVLDLKTLKALIGRVSTSRSAGSGVGAITADCR